MLGCVEVVAYRLAVVYEPIVLIFITSDPGALILLKQSAEMRIGGDDIVPTT
jgi:hypothetical protein